MASLHINTPSVRRNPLPNQFELTSLNVPYNSGYGKLNEDGVVVEDHRTFRGLRSLVEIVWLVEILGLVLGWICFAAIIITLAVHRNRPLPGWPLLISINSLVAIFTAIMKAALIMPVAEGIGQIKWNWFEKDRPLEDMEKFDSASRGPWGSFSLIFGRVKSLLALLGALITVVALAIDPFSQQVLQYYDCRVPSPGITASVSISNNYTRYGVDVSSKDRSLDLQMANAIYNGVINPPQNASQDIVFNCQSGNCTFPNIHGMTYSTLSMCGKCEDLTSTIIQNNTNGTDGPVIPDDLPQKGFVLPSTFDPEAPSGNCSIATLVAANFSVVDPWLCTSTYWPNFGAWYLSAFDTLMYTNCSCVGSADANWGSNTCDCTAFAANCALYPCVKTFNASIENFVLSEDEISSVAVPLDNTLLSNTWVSEGVVRNGKWQICDNSSIQDSDHPEALYINTTYSEATNTSTTEYQYYPEGCLWSLGWASIWAMRTYLAQNIWGGAGNTGEGTLIRSEINAPYGAIGTPWLELLFNNGTGSMESVNNYINGLANTMTAVIRQYGDIPPSMEVQGTMYAMQTCIGVEWAWLSLPATLLVLGTIFLFLVIGSTKGRSSMVWKSSILPVILHGFDSETIEQYRSLSRPSEMRDATRTLNARLEEDQFGRHFILT